MKKKILDLILKILSLISGKNVVYTNKGYISHDNLAVKSKYGFWYCGNVFDQTDIAYGIASVGDIESEDSNLVFKILKSLKEDYTFYDIGANTGWYSMLSANTSHKSTAISFEPILEHVESLAETIKLNRFDDRVSVKLIALSDTDGEANISLAGTGSSLEKDFLENSKDMRKVDLKTLDNLVENQNLQKPDFIKIDIEGHEYKALLGATKTISSSLPVLFIEIAYSLKNINRKFINPNHEKTFSFLKSFGYDAYRLEGGKLVVYNPEEKLDGVQMFLFLHNKKHIGTLNLINGN